MTMHPQSEEEKVPTGMIRRRMTLGECQRSVAFSGFYALLLLFAVLFAPHAYMKVVFATSALIRLNALRRAYSILRRVQRGEIVATLQAARREKADSSAAASLVAVVLATVFALCCTVLSILALLTAGNSNDAALFFLVANLIVWGFAALIWRSAYRTARRSAVAGIQMPHPVSNPITARMDSRETEPTTRNDAPIAAHSAHWWTDTPTREAMKLKAQR